jgi:hypothetical protein
MAGTSHQASSETDSRMRPLDQSVQSLGLFLPIKHSGNVAVCTVSFSIPKIYDLSVELVYAFPFDIALEFESW